MTTKVAVVTGSNRGIGLSIVKGLAKDFDGDVYLTARDENKGKEGLQELEKQGVDVVKVKFHKLDIADEQSIKNLAAFIKEK